MYMFSADGAGSFEPGATPQELTRPKSPALKARFIAVQFQELAAASWIESAPLALDRYVALTTRRKEYGISAGGVYWTKVQYLLSQCFRLISP